MKKKKTKTNKTQTAVRTNKNTNFTKNTGLGTRQKYIQSHEKS